MISRPRLAGAAAVALGLLSQQAKAQHTPFYVTPVEDKATVLNALDMRDGRVTYYSESHALLIGNANYTRFQGRLPGVKPDVGRLADVLHRHRFKVEVHFDLKTAELAAVVEDFIRRHATVRNSRILIYVAGHGVSTYQSGVPFGYIVPVDAPDHRTTSVEDIAKLSLPMQMFAAWAAMPQARHMLFVFDACFSGSFFGRPDGRPPERPTASLPLAGQQAVARAEGRTPPAVPAPGPEISSNYIFQEEVQDLGRQFISAGRARETVRASSVFTDLFVQLLSHDLNPPAQINFDNWTTGIEIGNWLAMNGRDQYGDAKDAATPIFDALQEPSIFRNGNIVFSRLQYHNRHWLTDATVTFPEPGTVSRLVSDEILREATALAAVPPAGADTQAVADMFAATLGASRAAGAASATAARLEEEASRQSGRPADAARLAEEAQRARRQASEYSAQVERQISTLAGTAKPDGLPQGDPAEAARIADALRQVTAAVASQAAPQARQPAESTLSAVDEAKLQEMVNNFSSLDDGVRRGARVQMAAFLGELSPPKAAAATSRLLLNLADKSYRFQLGVSVAIGRMAGNAPVQDLARARREIEQALDARAGRDPTLRENLTRALGKLSQA